MSKVLFAGLLAGALMVPQSSLNADTSEGLRLPPIPYAETIPWLTGTPVQKPGTKLGLLLAPKQLSLVPSDFAQLPSPNNVLLSSQMVSNAITSTE